MKHVGIGHHDVPCLSDRSAAAGRRVAVVRVNAQIGGKAVLQRAELRQLVLRQCFGRKHKQSPPVRALQEALENGQVVAQCFSACGRRHHHQVAAAANRLVGVCLVGIEPFDATRRQRTGELGPEIVRQGNESSLCRRDHVVQRHLALEVGGEELRKPGHRCQGR